MFYIEAPTAGWFRKLGAVQLMPAVSSAMAPNTPQLSCDFRFDRAGLQSRVAFTGLAAGGCQDGLPWKLASALMKLSLCFALYHIVVH